MSCLAELINHRTKWLIMWFAQQICWVTGLNDPTFSQHENLYKNSHSHQWSNGFVERNL